MSTKPVWIDRSLINSKAFTSLRRTQSAKVLLKFLSKRQFDKPRNKRDHWPVKNNGNITFTYAEASKWAGVSDRQFTQAIDELIENGFLKVAYQGAGSGDPSLYTLTANWQKYGTSDFTPNPPRRKRTDRGAV